MDIPKTPELGNRSLRQFGLTTGAIVAALFGVTLPFLFDRPLPVWPWILGAVPVAVGLLHPSALRPVYRGWMAVGHALGWANTRLILAVMFCAMIIPAGLIMRAIGRDPISRRLTAQKSYRAQSHDHPRDRFERPF